MLLKHLLQCRGHRVHDVLLIEPLATITCLVVVVDAKLQLRRELHEGHVVLQTAHLWKKNHSVSFREPVLVLSLGDCKSVEVIETGLK